MKRSRLELEKKWRMVSSIWKTKVCQYFRKRISSANMPSCGGNLLLLNIKMGIDRNIGSIFEALKGV
jgi:hypothetical protein